MSLVSECSPCEVLRSIPHHPLTNEASDHTAESSIKALFFVLVLSWLTAFCVHDLVKDEVSVTQGRDSLNCVMAQRCYCLYWI